jgi:hypothetical protein
LVSIISANSRVKAVGAFAARSSDTFTITGCPFFIGPSPHPCVLVRWVQPNAQSRAVGDFTLNDQSTGLCVAPDQAVQGTALVTFTQAQVAGR